MTTMMRNNNGDCQVAKEATTTIDNVANKVAKRNHVEKYHNDKLQVANKVENRNDNNKENDNGPRATR